MKLEHIEHAYALLLDAAHRSGAFEDERWIRIIVGGRIANAETARRIVHTLCVVFDLTARHAAADLVAAADAGVAATFSGKARRVRQLEECLRETALRYALGQEERGWTLWNGVDALTTAGDVDTGPAISIDQLGRWADDGAMSTKVSEFRRAKDVPPVSLTKRARAAIEVPKRSPTSQAVSDGDCG